MLAGNLRVLVVVPAYNEEENIAATLREVAPWVGWENVLVVNDGSTDRTAVLCAELPCKLISLPFNLGIGGAVETGFKYAVRHEYDVVVQIDADGQHIPDGLPALMEPIIRGEADVSVGSRFIGEHRYRAPLIRRFGMLWFSWLVSLLAGQRFTDTTSGFRATASSAMKYLAINYPDDYPEVEALLMLKKAGFRIAEVSAVMRDRQGGTSSINRIRAVYYMLKVTLSLLVTGLRGSRRKSRC